MRPWMWALILLGGPPAWLLAMICVWGESHTEIDPDWDVDE